MSICFHQNPVFPVNKQQRAHDMPCDLQLFLQFLSFGAGSHKRSVPFAAEALWRTAWKAGAPWMLCCNGSSGRGPRSPGTDDGSITAEEGTLASKKPMATVALSAAKTGAGRSAGPLSQRSVARDSSRPRSPKQSCRDSF